MSAGASLERFGKKYLGFIKWTLLKTNSLTFTCAKDDHATNHTYPRTTDPAYATPISVTSTTGTTIRVNVGINPDGNYAHTFVSATAGAVSLASGGGIPAEIVANDTLFVKTGNLYLFSPSNRYRIPKNGPGSWILSITP
mgnify:CR=1 FL=1